MHLERSVVAYFVSLPELNTSQYSRQVFETAAFRAINVLLIHLLVGFSANLRNLDI